MNIRPTLGASFRPRDVCNFLGSSNILGYTLFERFRGASIFEAEMERFKHKTLLVGLPFATVAYVERWSTNEITQMRR